MGKDKLEPNPNHTKEGKIDYTKKNDSNPAKAAGQKGEFIGDPSKIHIHIVSDNTHLKVAGKRFDFDPKKSGEVKAALKKLEELGTDKVSGYSACLKYLQKAAK